MTPTAITSTHQKALRINLDPSKYGTVAEIGAGQEVARWFFRVGGASGTIAKTMSAYDMTFSDAIYGASQRYVSRQRLQTMLDHEYQILIERLGAKRGAQTLFFSFADTVAARSYSRKEEGQGWMGVMFQTAPSSQPSQVIIHVRMMDTDNVREQEALGILGVNLVHGVYYSHEDPRALMVSLMDELSRDRVEIDMVKFSGPAFAGVDNRMMSLHLVNEGLTDVAMFTEKGEVVQPSEVLYKRPILVERGSFRPVTKLTMDMLECASKQFVHDIEVKETDPVVLAEITMHNLLSPDGLDVGDFLARADVLGSMGKSVLISKYAEYYHLADYLAGIPNRGIGIALGIPSLCEILHERYYSSLQGGLLESLGRLFKRGLRLYVHPLKERSTGQLVTADKLAVDPEIRRLYEHLLVSRLVIPMRGFEPKYLHIFPRDVLRLIQSGDGSWKTMVPPRVAKMIADRQLFGVRAVVPAAKA